jgi:ATP-dependent Zn protease
MNMASDEGLVGLPSGEATKELTLQWRRLIRTATAVAVLTSPVVFIWFTEQVGVSWGWALFWTFISVIAFRGLMDIILRRFIPWPSLFGTDEPRAREEDIVNRRRAWYWAKWFRRAVWVLGIITLIWFVKLLIPGGDDSWIGIVTGAWDGLVSMLSNPQLLVYAIIFPLLFVMNFLILLGPMLAMGITQMQGFEPGDAEWGVKLDDVRGQAEAKEEVRRVVSIWQSGEAFEAAGGKRERGMLFLGAPGTGKTMLSKAIATGFNCPFMSMPGSGFAQTFIGLDVVIVRYMAWKAKKLARKWGGQCIVFIDEIDAVGRRRSALGGEGLGGFSRPVSFEDFAFHGRHGSLTPSGDLILENRAWREKLFEARAPEQPQTAFQRLSAIVNQGIPGGLMGGQGQLALNQLLVVMDGIDNPPFGKRVFTNRINTFLDATYIVPRRIGNVSLRLPPPRPRQEQIYFIGATNVPLEALDPALTRPGRMGRYVWLRTPTKKDRLDIFDLYLAKVNHDPELDTEKRRDEIARITNGYAQPLDANVLTPTGWKQMGDLEVGDEVIGGDGKPTTVVGVHPRGEMDVYRVQLNDGTSTRCTADHLWSVDALDPRMLRRTFTLTELMDRQLRWSINGSRLYLPKLPAVEFPTAKELPIDPYLLGFMLGDGGLTSTSPDICSADEESVARVAELLPVGVSLVQHGPSNWWLSSGRRGGKPNPLTDSLRTIGLWGRTSHTKFIPDAYKLSSVDNRLALLQGLLDTDGSVDYRRGTGTEYYTASKRLADDVADVVRSLGGLARVKRKREGWRVAIEMLNGHEPFRLTRKAAVHRGSRRPFRRRITAVEPEGRDEVQCITVANDDGLYVTDDYIVTHNSPAMIEQVCSMALTYAHHEGKISFGWEHIVEAMTTIESGMAINIDYIPEETRAVAIHEAGHAVAGHAFMKGAESTRLSIRRRGEALGHHQALEKEERFSSWRSEEMSRLIWTLGAMAAERVFYGENSTGVGGDVQSATARSAWMVGACAMAPERIEFADGFKPERGKTEDDLREEIAKKYERIGVQIMNRAGGGNALHHDPLAGVFSDPAKRAMAAQLLGHAYVLAHQLIEHNKPGVERVADVLVDRRELHGDEIIGLLESVKLEIPPSDPMNEESWPKL